MTLLNQKQAGFSLVELLIASVIGMVIIGMLGSAYLSSAVTNRALSDSSLLTENGRYATQVLNDQIQLAGYFGALDLQAGPIPAALPNPCTINLTTLTDGMSLPIQGYNDTASFTASCLPTGDSLKAGADVLVIRRAYTSTISVAALSVNEYYVQSSSFDVIIGKGDATFSLTEKDGVTPVTIRKYVQTIFYVSGTDNQLKKLKLFEDGYTVTPIADNVEYFEVEYGIDRSGNGSPNESATGDDDFVTVISTADIAMWQDVVSVRGYILVRGEEEVSPSLDKKVYTIGTAGNTDETVGPFNDNYRRKLFFFSARANNLSMRREGTI